MDSGERIIIAVIGTILGGALAFFLGAKSYKEVALGAIAGRIVVGVLVRLVAAGGGPVYCDYCGHKAGRYEQACTNCNATLPDVSVDA